MDKYDPEKRVALVVDEWGTWFDVEPGTNPGFLYQQNTLRDAVSAAISLNIFNNHSDRVRMTNIAQTINVLQAPILTEGAKMVLTPTYHVFDMFKVHQDATYLPVEIKTNEYGYMDEKLPQVSSSASVDEKGVIHVSLCNISLNEAAEVNCNMEGLKADRISGKVLASSAMNTYNTFGNPEQLKPKEFTNCSLRGKGFNAVLPPMSVVVLAIE
jgi:alpha-N-arabinofuranosidase